MSQNPRPGGETESSPGPAAPKRVLISTAEPSADLHGAALIRQVRKLRPNVEFVGLGGPRMREAGCRIIGDVTARASMLLGTLGLVGRAWRLLRELDRLMDSERIDLGVVVDSPVLHLPLAKRMKRRGVPVLYYIAPQTWAWAEYRIAKVRRRTDRLAVILPFEESYFREHGLAADYVGHPLGDHLAEHEIDESLVKGFREGADPVVAVLPGSRKQVVREVLPGQIEVCRQIARRFSRARFLLSVAGDPVRPLIESHLSDADIKLDPHEGRNGELLEAADLVLVASGTATLEVAFHRTPMIVMYNHSRWIYELFGRWFIHTPHLSLPNIIAQREIVPEYMPYYRSPDPIAARAIEMLSTPHTLPRMRVDLERVMSQLDRPGASANTARMVLEMLDAGADDGHDDSTQQPHTADQSTAKPIH